MMHEVYVLQVLRFNEGLRELLSSRIEAGFQPDPESLVHWIESKEGRIAASAALGCEPRPFGSSLCQMHCGRENALI